jgi:hypothetical protein
MGASPSEGGKLSHLGGVFKERYGRQLYSYNNEIRRSLVYMYEDALKMPRDDRPGGGPVR